MTTKAIIEALLFQTPGLEKYLRAAHIISKERNWKAKEHTEFYFLNKFKDPRFLIIITNQVHVYLIGEIDKKRAYNILNIEGFNTNHMVISKGELLNLIKTTVTEKLFLPDNYSNRIIYMYDDTLFIFNKLENTNKNMFAKAVWSLGTDIYDVEAKTYQTNAKNILSAIFSEF